MSELLKNAEIDGFSVENAIKKLKKEREKAKNKNFATPIIEHLLKRCAEDPGMAEDIMKTCKTWDKCFAYILQNAKKQATGNCAAVEDEVVYEWAEDYYRKEDKPEPKKKAEEKKTAEKKPVKKVEKTEVPEQKQKNKKQVKKKTEEGASLTGQLSLFDLM